MTDPTLTDLAAALAAADEDYNAARGAAMERQGAAHFAAAAKRAAAAAAADRGSHADHAAADAAWEAAQCAALAAYIDGIGGAGVGEVAQWQASFERSHRGWRALYVTHQGVLWRSSWARPTAAAPAAAAMVAHAAGGGEGCHPPEARWCAHCDDAVIGLIAYRKK